MFDLAGKTLWIAGHTGMLGSAIMRRLKSEPCTLLTTGPNRLDLTRQADVENFLTANRPDAIILAAAKVGGILANRTWPAQFLYENLMIATNVIAAAHATGIDRLVYIGSSCAYPRLAPQPIPETALLTGPLESTNEAYAIAKIAGVKLAHAYRTQYGRNYIAVMPTNLFGPGDSFDLSSCHVLPALIHKAHDAKITSSPTMILWGTGSPRREFLHVDDCADALVLLLKTYSGENPVNIGSGTDISILDLARLVRRTTGFTGEIVHDLSKPDGTPQKLLSSDTLRAMGWTPKIDLADGIASTYRWFVEHQHDVTVRYSPAPRG